MADRHLHTTGIDWNKEQMKCLSDDTWLDDDEELGIQIVKVRHTFQSTNFVRSIVLFNKLWALMYSYCVCVHIYCNVEQKNKVATNAISAGQFART